MTADVLPAAAIPAAMPMRRLIVAATIGNVLEWFDFLVYGFFAVILAEVFFPATNPNVSLLVTFGGLRALLCRAAARRGHRRQLH
jgi:hypothetical protein